MIIDCIADLHGYKPKLPGGDLLILAGDYTAADKLTQWVEFFKWLKEQPYRKKVLIAGNHDNFFESGFPKTQKETNELQEVQSFLSEIGEMDETPDFQYLCDSGTEFEGLKIWGTPWTPWFHGVNPKCKAFMKSDEKLDSKFSLIPEGIDILITHGPMRHILDASRDGYACGSSSLREHIDRIIPRFHVFGHIHEQGGSQLMYNGIGSNTWCINCSYVDENYRPVNSAIRLEIV